ncbi:MAG: hypothetical protein WAM69_10065, partial [Candidatus Sulfotelmatobacter sp.]
MRKLAIHPGGSKRPRISARSSRPESGFILLTLLLVVALMTIAAAAVLPTISFDIRRDQEEEMIHRGVQYSRAIRVYYKKFGRYPTKLEDLDNTNNLRYLRRHYKDPITGKDFRLLHFGDPGVTLGGGFSVGGGTIPGATPAGGMNGFGSSSSGPGNSGFGGSGFGSSGPGGSGVNSSGVFSQSSGFGGNSNSAFGTNSNSQTGSGQQGQNAGSGSDSSQEGSSSSGGQVFGGGPIVGVASTSKKTTIREFNHKKKYNESQFVYDPTTDRGFL